MGRKPLLGARERARLMKEYEAEMGHSVEERMKNDPRGLGVDDALVIWDASRNPEARAIMREAVEQLQALRRQRAAESEQTEDE